MFSDFELLQTYWLFLLPFPWLWLYWRLHFSVQWPQLLPVLNMRYPLLESIEAQELITKKHFKKVLNHKDLMMVISLSLMILALSQPIHYGTVIKSDAHSDPVDLILVVDTALSMSLSDYEIQGEAVSRLAMSQLLLEDFINQYSGKRIGLVILDNPPALWLPLTTDKNVVQDAVSRITTLLGGRLSNMGATLKLISEEFQDNQEKVIVLISDGGVQVGEVSPQDAAKNLLTKDFTLYSIALGSSDADLGSLDNSSLIYQPANLTLLQQLADIGQGQMFHTQDAQAFSTALQSIENKHRRAEQKQDILKLHNAWYPLPLGLAMLLLLYAGLLQKSTSHQETK